MNQKKNLSNAVEVHNSQKKGFDLLFDYLEDYEEQTREPYILDVIGVCCEWTETTIKNCLTDTGYTIHELTEATIVLQDDDVLLYMNF